jgi:uncharacterized protein
LSDPDSLPPVSETFERASLASTRRYRLRSQATGETYQIDVALPGVEVPAGRPMRVVYLTDANTVFGIAAQSLRFLQQGDGAAPALLVGIGYCLDGATRPRHAYGALRARDFTPSLDEGFLARLGEARQGRAVPGDIRPAGGAHAFLSFIVDELGPFVAERYEVDAHDQSLIGSSLGGLFSLYALLSRPGAFRRHGAHSPSLWWNDGELFALEAEVARTTTDLPVDLFLSVGGEETDPQWDMVGGVQRFAAALEGRRYPGLRQTTHVFEGETHTSVIPAALSRSFRTLLRAPT